MTKFTTNKKKKRNFKEEQAVSVVNGQTIDREVEIGQIGLQCLGKGRIEKKPNRQEQQHLPEQGN